MHSEQTNYQICVKGHLDKRWELTFEGLTITPEFGQDGTPTTMLTGTIADQSALYGVLTRLRNMGVSLISIQPLDQI